jgi:hypothetical protein
MKNYKTFMSTLMLFVLSLVMAGCDEQLDNPSTPVEAPQETPTLTVTVSDLSLSVGASEVRAAVSNSDAVITYSSSDPSVVSIDANGKITALAAGTATITVSVAETAKYKGATVSFKVTVADVKPFDKVTSSDLGKIIGSDGLIYANKSAVEAAGKTGIAMIVYVGDAGTADASSTTYKGLAIALTDANTSSVVWAPSYVWEAIGPIPLWLTNDSKDASLDIRGISNTAYLVGKGSSYEAATAVDNYNVPTPTGTSDWFLPSMGQWYLFLHGMCGWTWDSTNVLPIALGDVDDNLKAVNQKFIDAGYSSAETVFEEGQYYWSSTEGDASYAWYVTFKYKQDNGNIMCGGNGGTYHYKWKVDYLGNTSHVRAFLAF